MTENGNHSMQRRSPGNNYTAPGIYHITINVHDRKKQSLGKIVGNLQCPDGHPDAPRTELSAIGKMVEHELTHSISSHYPVIEIQDYVIMPEHLHFIAIVKNSLISKSGRQTHLGQIIAGFKKGCNRHYWEITNQQAPTSELLSPVVSPQGNKVASSASTGRTPLFSHGYVDIIPLKEGQLETQRAYIHSNPRNRLLRTTHHTTLSPQRNSIDTLVTLPALYGYLVREHALFANDQETRKLIASRLLVANRTITCDSYGNLELCHHKMLPVVCHRKDQQLFTKQKTACLEAAQQGTILVSPRISKGEQEIMDEVSHRGHPIILITESGFPQIYHPSEARLNLCATNKLLLLTPWHYHYRSVNESISVAECKTMNCIAQAICRTKDDWWKQEKEDR